MLPTMIRVLEEDRTLSLEVHDGLADVVLAALSAEPATIDELREALGRYLEPEVVAFIFRASAEGPARRVPDGGHLIIDLAARLVVNLTSGASFPRVGCVLRCDQQTTLDVWLPYRISSRWRMITQPHNWRAHADRRRAKRRATPDLDARAVLYGRLAESLVGRYAEVAGHQEAGWADIQDWWLLTPRPDLRDQCPRAWLLARRRAVDGDVQDQGETWSLLGHAPPGLSPRSHAFRFAGFGTHEIILYHELVATLLHELLDRVPSPPSADWAAEVRHLEQSQQEWLHQPQPDLYDLSPAALIARERARLPAVVPPGHARLDDDCPLCRMIADSGRPMIWQLGNYLLEDRFATSFTLSRAEWEQRRRMIERAVDRVAPPGSSLEPPADDGEPRVWQNSYTNMAGLIDMPPRESVTVLLFAIGGHLGELVHDLYARHDATELVRQLHLRFDELREPLREQAELYLVQSAAAAFISALEEVAAAREDLRAKCADLEAKLYFLEDRYAAHLGQDVEML